MTLTSGDLDEHRKCIVPRSSHRDGGGASGVSPGFAPQKEGHGDQISCEEPLGPGPEMKRVGHAQAPVAPAGLQVERHESTEHANS
jgi:hypothetical protein